MKSKLCDMLGIEFPLIAFSHCRDVVVEVSKAGGLGVLGAASFSAEQLEIELTWIDEQLAGTPYGVDLIAPTSMAVTEENDSFEDIKGLVPDNYRQFASSILEKHDIDSTGVYADEYEKNAFLTKGQAGNIIDVAFSHPIKLIANALGVPPAYMIEMGRRHGVATAALIGTKEHAIKQVQAGVDIVVASGTEAGGHCGEVSTMVVVPEVIKAVKQIRDVPVLAAGGIMTGRQMAAAMAMGAAGAWTGSVWLATVESETTETFRQKMIAASSRDAVRSRGRTGKPARQLRSVWTDA
ncbi:MAG: nitronate monooxygenase, partial [Pseudohongiella sp.]